MNWRKLAGESIALFAIGCMSGAHLKPTPTERTSLAQLKPAAGEPYVLLYGDSLTSQHCNFYPAMRKEFPRVSVVPAGIVGASTWEMARSFAPEKWTPPPDLVVLLMGVNNFAHDPYHQPERGWADLEGMRQRALRARVPVLIGTPLPYGRWNPVTMNLCPTEWSNQYVAELRRFILERSAPDIIDFDQAIPFDNPEQWLPDCLHPSSEGAERMAWLVRAAVCERLWRPEFARLCAASPTPAGQ